LARCRRSRRQIIEGDRERQENQGKALRLKEHRVPVKMSGCASLACAPASNKAVSEAVTGTFFREERGKTAGAACDRTVPADYGSDQPRPADRVHRVPPW